MKTLIITFITSALFISGYSQSDRAILDLESTDKGLLIPRLTTIQKNAMSLTAVHNGLLVYDKEENEFFKWNGSSLAWEQQSTQWQKTNNGIYYDTSVSVGTNQVYDGIDFLVRQTAIIGEEGSIFMRENNSGDSTFAGSIFLSQVDELGIFDLLLNKIDIRANGNTPAEFGPDDSNPEIVLYNDDGSRGITLDYSYNNPEIELNDSTGMPAIRMSSQDTFEFGSTIKMYNTSFNNSLLLDGDVFGGGYIGLNDSNGNLRMSLLGTGFFPSFSPQINLYDNSGNFAICIDGDYQGTGDGRVITQELEITGGSDLAEYFDISDNQFFEDKLPGLVVSIDEENPGSLKVSNQAYDKKLVGVISGAQEIESGLIMGQKNSIAYGDHAVSLVGRVYVKATTRNGKIAPGDLLTTSEIPGFAMKATNRKKSWGSIIGKAMTALDEKEGYVLVILMPQ